MHLDAHFSISSMMRTWGDIEDDSSEPNSIIVTDRRLIAKTADPIDIHSFGQWPPRSLGFPCWLCEPRVEIRFEGAVEKASRLLRCGNSCQPSS